MGMTLLSMFALLPSIFHHVKTPGLSQARGQAAQVSVFLRLFSAHQIADGAAGLAGRLAGRLTFAAAFKFDGILKRTLIDGNDMFGHNDTSRPNFYMFIIP